MRLKPVQKIHTIHSENFIRSYMKPRLPVILEDFVSPESPAFKKWNYDYFKEIAGDEIVNVYGNELDSLDKVASDPVTRTKFSEYLDLIKTTPTEHRLFLFNLLKISYCGLCSHSAGDSSFHCFFLAFGALVLWTTSTGFFDIFLFSGI